MTLNPSFMLLSFVLCGYTIFWPLLNRSIARPRQVLEPRSRYSSGRFFPVVVVIIAAPVSSFIDIATMQSSVSRAIDTPDAGAAGRHVEKHEAVKHRQFAVVLDRPKTHGQMADEIGRGHMAAGDESRDHRAQADRNQHARDDFNQPGNPHEGEDRRGGAVKAAE